MKHKSFPVSIVNLSRAFDFRICFKKTLVAFDFDEKFTQSVVQITMLYQVSEDFLRLPFAVDQLQCMTWKWKNAV